MADPIRLDFISAFCFLNFCFSSPFIFFQWRIAQTCAIVWGVF